MLTLDLKFLLKLLPEMMMSASRAFERSSISILCIPQSVVVRCIGGGTGGLLKRNIDWVDLVGIWKWFNCLCVPGAVGFGNLEGSDEHSSDPFSVFLGA